MNPRTRLVLENAKDGALSASLEYTMSNGESITMVFLLPKPKPGQSSMTLKEIEEAMLQRASEFARHTLAGLHGNGKTG